ncbi:helix-turn-helix transcriptional regulator [Gayadomonas joobiniege]|uniref:helix-turn-helix transcriptional regulator n=1 Tax=Gayadomonas joobiniege TaxID=1234606 RepID=UPI0003622B97|nr:AraC family transcriptional regulator [Gayadomonas joobiniege]
MVLANNIGDILEIGEACKERFVDCEKVPELESLNIHLSGISHLRGHYKVGRISPYTHSLFYCNDGEISVTMNQQTLIARKGQIIVIPAGQSFLLELQADYWEMAWFALDDTANWQSFHNLAPGIHSCANGKQIFHLLGHLYYESSAELRAPSIKLLAHYLNQTFNATPISEEIAKLKQLRRDIEKSLHYDWTVETMAQTIHYSSPHLHKLFKRHFQLSPIQYLIKLRMQRAKYLLTNSQWSIQQIAEQVGYSDVFNFAKRFKKSVGLAPGQYRKSGGL